MKKEMWQIIRLVALLFLIVGVVSTLFTGGENATIIIIVLLVLIFITNFLFNRKIEKSQIAREEKIRIEERQKANEQKKDS